MKLCIVNPNYFRSSGVTTVIKNNYKGMLGLGIEQYFINCRYFKNDENQFDDISWISKSNYIELDLMSNNLYILVKSITLFLMYLKKNKIDVVHVHHRRLALISVIFEFFGFKTLYTAHLPYKFSILFWIFSPKYIVAISDSIFRNIQLTTRAKNIYLIGNPINFPDTYPPCSFDDINTDQAVCIARLEPVKGHKFLLDAWSLIKSKGYFYKLVLIGEGSLLEVLSIQIRNLGLEDMAFIQGYSQNVIEQVKQSLFSILVSEIEGLPMVVIEAASIGRPTLLNNVDGSKDCLIRGLTLPNGLPYGDTETLANTIIHWFSNKAEVLQDGKLFFDAFQEKYSIKSVSKKYSDLLTNMIE